MLKIKRALISVFDKNGLLEFAKILKKNGVEIISTGGTFKYLKDNSIEVTSISDVTGFPEILDGRVKTLHPKIHAGLLAILDNQQHLNQIKELGIEPIDMVCINLYPFEETVKKAGLSDEEIIEQIDIGGPSMLRAASKNYKFTAAVSNPDQYEGLINELESNNGSLSETTLRNLAKEVFRTTAHYDALIFDYFDKNSKDDEFPELLTLGSRKEYSLFVDGILLDSGNQNLKIKILGGTGKVHDWTISKKIRESIAVPLILAGGLNSENVAEAIKFVSPFAVDVCSGVRTNGILDEEKLKIFIQEVQNEN